MPKPSRFFACVVVVGGLLWSPTVAAPGVQAVPVPLLAGLYAPAPQAAAERSAEVSYLPPRVLGPVRLHVVGSVATGTVNCSGGDEAAGVALTATAVLAGGAVTVPLFRGETGDGKDFDLVMDTVYHDEPLPEAVIAALLAGELVLQLSVDLAWPPACAGDPEIYQPPYAEATVVSVTLLVEGDFPVGDDRRAWGGIKALYR